MIKVSYDRENNELYVQSDAEDLSDMMEDALMVVHGLVHSIRVKHGKEASDGLLRVIRNLDDTVIFSLYDIGEGFYEDGPAAGETDDRGDCTEDQGVRPAQERCAPGTGGSCRPGAEESERG